MNALLQRFPPVRFFTPFALVILLFCGTGWLTTTGALPAFFRSEGQTEVSHPAAAGLSFAERVAYQRIIEDVYWRHRIWPKQNPDPKPSLDAVMSQAQLENKVRGYLRDSLVLEDYWQKPITAEQLQAEMDRMAADTRQPQVLRELFEALGNDPAVIAECLARPGLTEGLMADLSLQDQTPRFESPRTDNLRTMSVVTTLGQVVYTLPTIAHAGDPPCPDDTWTATSTTNAPFARYGHTAVWTGSEMIVWGGYFYDGNAHLLNTGGRYIPSTDSWTATSTTNAPSGRLGHTAVWTGREMIIWGGEAGGFENNADGHRYNPATDTWSATNMGSSLHGRTNHTAVWTGSEMIVWGGWSWYLTSPPIQVWFNDGARYNPGRDSWAATSAIHAPAARELHTAVWTGSEMIVWGGVYEWNPYNDGGRYNPSTNSWTAPSTTNAPSAGTAVWTGSEMIVWAGVTGGRYNPTTNSWTTMSTTNAPFSGTAVWTGSEMIVWGGAGDGSGGRYDPSTDRWTATSIANAVHARDHHTAVWTGSEMIVWGGAYWVGNSRVFLNTGGRYCAPFRGSQLRNISTRAFVQTGDNVVIGGFMVQGAQTKRVIIRAIGAELAQYGIPNPLYNPTLELHDRTGALIASNDNWIHTTIGGIIASDQVPDIRDSGYAPRDVRESAIIADLAPGNYTAIVRGVNNMTGVALVEVYDLSDDASSVLGNISTRSFVQTGDNVMIGGFIVAGIGPKRVIVRAIGPELGQYGVPSPLANPTLELHDHTGALIGLNDNWQTTIIGGIITTNQVTAIQNSGYAPANPFESAIIATLPPGNYTAIVRGVANTTGVALVEVYDLQQ